MAAELLDAGHHLATVGVSGEALQYRLPQGSGIVREHLSEGAVENLPSLAAGIQQQGKHHAALRTHQQTDRGALPARIGCQSQHTAN